ncbi:MAG: transglycosylase SLT domain-containing protein [Paracoccaceae bacterium]|nr:transglycosylase SLT domain-containing protein [Paracoccaceae bacterium]
MLPRGPEAAITGWKGLGTRLSRIGGKTSHFKGETQMNLQIFSAIITLSLILARTSDANPVCEDAAQKAADATGVPWKILHAITLAETGRSQDGQRNSVPHPWPWTVHTQGDGHWFSTPQEARDFIAARQSEGERNIDIGCFQLNLRWHATHFSSVEQMLDPLENALYAAKFLSGLFAEMGDWRRAAGAYHSRNSQRAEHYVRKLDEMHQAQNGTEHHDLTPSDMDRAPPPIRLANHFTLPPTGRGIAFTAQRPLRGAVQPLIGGLR